MIDDLLRTAVRDLADESGTPSDLAAGAIAEGYRIRRRRRATTVAAALAAVLVVTVPFVVLRTPADETRPLPAATVTVAPAREFDDEKVFTGLGGARLLAIEDRTTSYVLDPQTGGYRKLPANVSQIEPSPGERYVAVWRNDSEWIRILDLRTGDYWRPPLPAPTYVSWSADGTRLLVSHENGYSVVDPASQRWRTKSVDFGQMPCLDYCRFTWYALDTAVVLPQAWKRGEEQTRISGLTTFEADSGEVSLHLPIEALPLSRYAASPDGRLMLTQQPRSPEQVTIVEITSGREVAHFTAAWSQFLDDGTVLAQNGGVLTRYDATGAVLEKMELPEELIGRVLTFGR